MTWAKRVTWAKRKAAGIHSWIFSVESAERLAALRIGLFLVLAARLSRRLYLELAGQPPALFRPLSFMNMFSSMPQRPVVIVVQILGVGSALMAAAGLFTRLSVPTAWTSAVFLNGMHTSIGKVMHNDVMLLLCVAPLLLAPCADAWSIDARRRGRGMLSPQASVKYGWPIRTAMIVVAGAYFFAGLAKVRNSGPAWAFGDNMRWILYASSDSQPEPNALALFIAGRVWLARVFATMTLAFELGFPLVLWRPRAAWLFVPGAVALHVGIWLTMHLDYTAWIATVVIVFVNWPSFCRLVRSLLEGVSSRLRPDPPGANSSSTGGPIGSHSVRN
ncbi:MAG: hypothetical protein ACR2FO_09195 [Actinomycetota bacterium]